MATIVKVGDPVSCGDQLAEGSPDVKVHNQPVGRVGIDLTAGHCFLPTNVPSDGGSKVYINGHPVITAGMAIAPHCCPPLNPCHGGVYSENGNTVYVGT